MEDGTTVCSDSHRCENYSTCIEYPNNEGTFFCDCDAGSLIGDSEGALQDSRYAGIYCEHRATSFCKKGHFCVNDGRCVERKHHSGGTYEGCDCPGGDYEGKHCEFVKGSTPHGWATPEYARRSSASAKSGMSGGATTVIVLAVLAIVAGVGLLVVRKVRNKDQRENVGPAGEVGGEEENGSTADETKKSYSTRSIGHVPTDLQLDADGGVLQAAVDDMANEENGGAGDGDDDVVDVEII